MGNLELFYPTIFYSFEFNTFEAYIAQGLAIFLLNLLSFSYFIIKLYKLLCYSKLTFEWLPLLNPYVWPFSFFQVVTAPYFKFWAFLLPPLKLEKTSFEISAIVGLEAMNTSLYFCLRASNYLIHFLEQARAAGSL
jgi:hypothetical protein